MKLKLHHITSAVFCLMTVLGIGAARAQSCQPLLDDLINFAATPEPGTRHVIRFQMVANREAADLAQFVSWQFSDPGQGELRYTPGRWIGWFYFPPSLEGEGKQFFSQPGWFRLGEVVSHPFDPDSTEKLRVSFDVNPWSQTFGRLTYAPPNSPPITSDPQCRNGFLYGFLGDQERPDRMYIFTFEKATLPIQN
jgi:hypothetical protein